MSSDNTYILNTSMRFLDRIESSIGFLEDLYSILRRHKAALRVSADGYIDLMIDGKISTCLDDCDEESVRAAINDLSGPVG